MAWEYSEKTKQLFMDAVHGKPGTHLGEIEDPDGFGEHGSIACGDSMRFTFRVRKHPSDPTQDVITEARYLTFGCTSAIASSEALCAMIEGKGFTPIEALKISNQDIVDFLGGLPQQKIHCSVMGADALESAVFNWSQKRGVTSRSWASTSTATRERGPHRLQVLRPERALFAEENRGTESADYRRDHQRHQGRRGLHGLPSRSGRPPGPSQRRLGQGSPPVAGRPEDRESRKETRRGGPPVAGDLALPIRQNDREGIRPGPYGRC